MKKTYVLLLALVAAGWVSVSAADAPKKLLVVTTSTGFRHSSIPTGEKIIAQLAQADGTFTVDFVHQPPGKPADLPRGATPEQQAAHKTAADQWQTALKAALQKMSPESLKNYDGVAFVSTTGDLPIPSPEGFLSWLRAGHGFIGIHAASDTFHNWPAYIDMLGGEFDHHGAQLSIECLNQDPQNPATAHLGKSWVLTQEEVYQFKNYDPTKVHDLLILDKKPEGARAPGHYGVAWCKSYGSGRVFYTSLGHREDIWDADPNLPNRINSIEISKAYQQHILGGIKWALGLAGTNQ